MSGELTQHEASDLDRCEIVIERGIKTFVAVGKALLEIRDRNLYRTTYGTFEDYCQQRWQLARTTAYQLVDAARVAEALEATDANSPMSAIADIPAPSNEAQVRPLARLLPRPDAEPSERAQADRAVREAWKEAAQTAPRGSDGRPRMTAGHVAETVSRRTTTARPEQLAAVPSNADLDAELDAEMAATAERFRSEFAAAMARADDVLEFNMDRIAEVIDHDKLARYLRSWRWWCDEIERRTKPGLRIVGGGR